MVLTLKTKHLHDPELMIAVNADRLKSMVNWKKDFVDSAHSGIVL